VQLRSRRASIKNNEELTTLSQVELVWVFTKPTYMSYGFDLRLLEGTN
jgi:hypothetical protein